MQGNGFFQILEIIRLTTFQDTTGERVVLVFDGKGEGPKPEATQNDPDEIQIFYSPADASADGVIERLAAKYADGRRITVASRDRAVLDTCSAFGADAISANALLELVERAEGALRQKLGRG